MTIGDQMLDAFYSLGKKINKAFGQEDSQETEEGVVGEKFPELKLDMSNDDLGELTLKWQRDWEQSDVFSNWTTNGDANEDYWLGKQFQQPKVDKQRNLVDNVLFEALETYLPQVTQHNPEPVVTLDASVQQTPENLMFATNLKNKLGQLADELKLRLKLKKSARHWAIYLLGAVKAGWDMDRDIPTAKTIRPRKLILDPDATVDEDGYTGNRIGEHRKMQANTMLAILDSLGGEDGYKAIIEGITKGQLGTDIGFIEWWTNQYMCWTIKGKVLLKMKNPHWNYPTQQEAPADEQGNVPTNEDGTAQQITIPGFNHIPVPSMPYILLSVFNLGKQPVDDTSLMGQNLSSQDLVNKRLKQIDRNADSQNGGMVVSLERAGMTQQQAKGVTEALRKGGTVAIPAGAVGEAIARMSAPALPNDIYLQLTDTRSRMTSVFGVKGFQPQLGGGVKTVRSQILNQQLDQARISGGFSEYLEQFADNIYNWFVQLLYVYDDQYGGKQHPKVHLTIKEGSLLPKDSASQAQQAQTLALAGKMALIDLYKKLEYPNPEEMAANVWLEANAPEILFSGDPRVAQAIQMKQQAAAAAAAAGGDGGKKAPSESINFKDLPPEGKAQMAKQAGLDLHPEAIAAHDDVVHQRSKQPAIPAPVNQPQQQ